VPSFRRGHKVRQDGSGNTYWPQADRLGSVIGITDNGGVLKDAITYDSFGNIVSETAVSFRGSVAWQGMVSDSATGLAHTYNRDALIALGKWLGPDPIMFRAGDPNLYRVVRNNVPNAIDTTGLAPIDVNKVLLGSQLKGHVFFSFTHGFCGRMSAPMGCSTYSSGYVPGLPANNGFYSNLKLNGDPTVTNICNTPFQIGGDFFDHHAGSLITRFQGGWRHMAGKRIGGYQVLFQCIRRSGQ
jgi:RHS repeat-associated protein